MRWNKKPYSKHGDVRIKTGFLFFPKSINNEVRFLEYATWEELYLTWETSPSEWVATKWIDEAVKEARK